MNPFIFANFSQIGSNSPQREVKTVIAQNEKKKKTTLRLQTWAKHNMTAGISTGPLRRPAADVINGVWWIMSILCDWTEPAESLKVREEHNADCCPKTAH